MNRKSILAIPLGCIAAVLLLTAQWASATTVASNPANGATGVSVNTQIAFTFSSVMNPAYIVVTCSNLTAGTWVLTPSGVWSAGNTVVTYTPLSALPASSVIAWWVQGFDALLQPLIGPTSGTFTTGTGSGGSGSGTNALTSFQLSKVYSWDQYSAAAPVPDTNAPYYFSAYTTLASNRTAISITLTNPILAATNLTQNVVQHENYYFFSSMATSNALEAAYPQGNYSFTVSAAASNQTVQVVLPAGMTQPNPPHITNFVAAQSLNATQAFTLGWDAFVGGYSTDYVYVVISSGSSNVWKTPDPGVAGALNGTATTVTIPANSLQTNSSYTANIGFYHAVYGSNVTYVTGAMRATVTQFTVNTVGSVRPVITNMVPSGGHYTFDIQTSAGQTLTVVSSTNCAQALGLWPILLTTNSPGAKVHIVDPRSATNRSMFYRVRNGS